MEEISQLLNAEELNHKETPIKLEDTGISLRSVSFSYDGTTEVLHDVNLAIHPGTMTALVGPSGSGKSTVAKLIAGYWDVTSGSITLGGHEKTQCHGRRGGAGGQTKRLRRLYPQAG